MNALWSRVVLQHCNIGVCVLVTSISSGRGPECRPEARTWYPVICSYSGVCPADSVAEVAFVGELLWRGGILVHVSMTYEPWVLMPLVIRFAFRGTLTFERARILWVVPGAYFSAKRVVVIAS